MSLSISRQGRVYAALESTYAVAPTLTAADAIRHTAIDLPFDNFNRETLMEKQAGAGHTVTNRAARRKTAGFSLESFLRAGGALNTAPELDPCLEAAFGAKTSVTLATTVASSGVVGGATLTSAGAAAIGDPVLITCPDGKRRVRWLTDVSTNDVTWEPNLPAGQAPANGAAVVCGIRYHLTTGLSKSLTIAHYLIDSTGAASLERQVCGAGVQKFSITLDANGEPVVMFSGDAARHEAAQTKPGGFTTTGPLPPSGLSGEMVIGNTAAPFLKFRAEIENGLSWRRDEFGFAEATEVLRTGRRNVSIGLSAHVENESILYDPTVSGSMPNVYVQAGLGLEPFTVGSILAVRIRNAEFKAPKTSDGDEIADFDYTGQANDTTDGANDAIALAIF